MRSDLLLNLFRAGVDNDNKKFIEIAQDIIRDEDRKKHTLFLNVIPRSSLRLG
jgi:hypothetical protein